ncbi:hypothetical protein Tco_0412179 [Tanacetum coccineum]
MEDNDGRKTFLDYLCIDLNYVEEQRNNLMSKHRNLVQELNTCKEQLLVLKQAKLDLLTMQHVNTEILKENQNLRNELKELTSITEAWLNISNKVNQYNSEVFITGSNKPKLSEAEDSTLLNHDTGKWMNLQSIAPSPLLKKLTGAEPVSGPKTIKLILKSKSTFKAKTLKAPAGKLKIVKIEDDPPLAIVMKELNEIKLQISKNKSSYFRNKNSQQDYSLRRGIKPRNPQHVTKNCKTCGSNIHTTSDHNNIEWFRKREALQAKKVESFKSTKTESSSALRSKTPTKMYLKGTPSLGLKYSKRLGLDLKGYLDSNYAGCNIDRKSTSDASEAEDIVAAGCCAIILWIMSQLTDYDIIYEKIKNHTLKRDTELHFIPTQYQLADIFTMPLDEPTFKRLIVELGMLNIDSKPEASILTEEN